MHYTIGTSDIYRCGSRASPSESIYNSKATEGKALYIYNALPNLQTASIYAQQQAPPSDFLLEAMQQFISTPLRAPNSI